MENATRLLTSTLQSCQADWCLTLVPGASGAVLSSFHHVANAYLVRTGQKGTSHALAIAYLVPAQEHGSSYRQLYVVAPRPYSVPAT
jgi:hypothetical protein